MSDRYSDLMNRGQVSGHIMTRGEVTIAAILAGQEVRNQMFGLNENVYDLETKVYVNRKTVDETLAGVNARLDELTTAATNCGHLLRENQLEVHNAHKRGVKTIVHMLFFLTCLVTCIGMNFGWVFYMEAIAEQERVDAGTARIAYLKKLWPVKAYFMCDWVMTVSYAGYRRFLWNWFF